MRVDEAIGIAELRNMALRRLPRIVGDWLEGGADDELAVRRNVDQFRRHRLVPRYLVDIASAETSVALFGRTYDCPFGIAPTGCPGLFWPDGDVVLARAAVEANVPFIMSGAATTTVERAAQVAPEHCWFQLYAARDVGITGDFVRRARDAGLAALVVTVDLPTQAKRERDIRNGFHLPPRLRRSTVVDGMLHPAWTVRYLASGGLPSMANWAPYAPKGADATGVAEFAAAQYYPTFTWSDLERVRASWPRTLILKGLMAPEDARRAAAMGVDGIIVSNHGGRQGDRLPASLEALPGIVEAAPEATVMLDGGIRRGADIVTALCLGARFAFVGRATLYGLAAGGGAGVRRALGVLKEEMLVTMRQIGRPTIRELTRDAVLDGRADRRGPP